ncbi:MAG: pilus assembly protein PilW, partial [Gammaproteobacteria bacterium]|nr:pilus assembly protein PilW [Gammaproteobacteria bacterium]
MKKQRGISIVEIMIAVTISLILLAGIGQIYLSNKQTYRMTDAVSRLQESGRFAMNFITQSVRSAGHWGC